MKIFILEDDDARITTFKDILGINNHTTIEIVKTAKEAISKLQKVKYDIIFLDHDLGGEQWVDSDKPNTGYQVAKILPKSINKKTQVILHTFNHYGAKNMLDTLRGMSVLYLPFNPALISSIVRGLQATEAAKQKGD